MVARVVRKLKEPEQAEQPKVILKPDYIRAPYYLEGPKKNWNPDYVGVYLWRQRALQAIVQNRSKDPDFSLLKTYYRARPLEFILCWLDTWDPRHAGLGKPVRMPFILFQRQAEMVRFIYECLRDEQNGLIEKSRDMGATWLACAVAVHLWLFEPGCAIGFGSRKEELVDSIGNLDSILEKARALINNVPPIFRPKNFDAKRDLSFLRLINRETGASIIGEIGDNIGRGGRKRLVFLDEAGHLEHAPKIEAALSETTRVRIDISSVSGMGTVFHNKREAGTDWAPGVEIPKGVTRVFTLDWSDHPEKDQAWYNLKRAKFESEGLLSIFAQEIDRDYAAAAQGVIIPGEWIVSCIDAHKKLGFDDSGAYMAGLDVADISESGDINALSIRKGVVFKYLGEWGGHDTGQTTRKAIHFLRPYQPLSCQYDALGVGAGVKAEYNRLVADKIIPSGIIFHPWVAGAKPLDPDKRVVPHDRQSPLNKDHFQNLRAQAWLQFRFRAERTHRAITDGRYKWRAEDLVSFDSTTINPALLQKLRKQLGQPTLATSSQLKVLLDKKPEGAKSPNLADSCIMCMFPAKSTHSLSFTAYHLAKAKVFKR
jgi:phage terminase large subunit